MSAAEKLRQAATAIRKEQDREENLGHIGSRELAAWRAVADLLDVAATVYPYSVTSDPAFAVALAYLGESA